VADSHASPDVCAHAGCGAARLRSAHCLEHLTPSEFEQVVADLRAGGSLNAGNTTISTECLHTLLDALRSSDGELELHSANFSGATFSSNANFSGATFSSHANFSGATFSSHANFDDATFSGSADFGKRWISRR
jgi:uncharacterized protein YjbI with pentapeptide repeats